MKAIRYAINSLLASLLVLLGFSSCKSVQKSQDGNNQDINPTNRSDNRPEKPLVYGPPPIYRVLPKEPVTKPLYGVPTAPYRHIELPDSQQTPPTSNTDSPSE